MATDGSKQMRCRHLTTEDKQTLGDLKEEIDAQNNSEAIKRLLAAYETKPNVILKAGDDEVF